MSVVMIEIRDECIGFLHSRSTLDDCLVICESQIARQLISGFAVGILGDFVTSRISPNAYRATVLRVVR